MPRLRFGLLLFPLTLHCDHRRVESDDASAPLATVALVAQKEATSMADYTSFKAAASDGDKAIGKTVLLHVTRRQLWADRVTLAPCLESAEADVMSLRATYAIDERPLVRAIPATPRRGNCRRVIVKVTGKRENGIDMAQLLEVLDVQSAVPAPPPPGVDYMTIDDVLIDGERAAGKVLQLAVTRQTDALDSKVAVFYPCDEWVGVEVHFRTAQTELVRRVPTDDKSCPTATLRLQKVLNPASGIWQADLVDVR